MGKSLVLAVVCVLVLFLSSFATNMHAVERLLNNVLIAANTPLTTGITNAISSGSQPRRIATYDTSAITPPLSV